jgi:glycerol-3-phosphate acyltransferase PlsX
MDNSSKTSEIIIALDCMGGDQAPKSVIMGAELALSILPKNKIFFKLFGNQNHINPLLQQTKLLRSSSDLTHTTQTVSAHEKPSVAIRMCRESSMQLAINAVKTEQAAAMVSAGNTGALMAMAKISLRTLPQITRPAIVAIMPSIKGRSVMLDLGANVECDATNLFEFAIMGEAFSRIIFGIEKPTIGLLNIGSEEVKGKDSVKLANTMFKETYLPINYFGYIEANDIAEGTVDVIVTDGFSGNVALKAIEGSAKLFKHFLKDAFSNSLLTKISYFLAKPALKKLATTADHRLYNGAMFVGLNGIVVKSHGSMDHVGLANAIKVAFELANADINKQIADELLEIKSED